MGKKNNITINPSPLAAQTIGVVKKKRFNWIGGIILIGFFAALIFYMPEIQELYNKYILGKKSNEGMVTYNNTNTTTNNNSNTNVTPEPEPEDDFKVEYIFLDETTTYTKDSFTLTNIKYEENNFVFNLESSKDINLRKENYYLELYDSEHNLLDRKYIYNKLTAGSKQTIRSDIKEKPTYFAFYEIPYERYDAFLLDPDENNQTYLSCSKESQTILYTFLDDKLYILSDVSTFNELTEDIKTFYESKAEQTNEKEGQSAYLNEDEKKYIVDVEVTKLTDDTTLYYFSSSSTAIEIKFKMEALDYTCK